MQMKIVVIIPAFNEEDAIGRVIKDIPQAVTRIIVVDNGSTDKTADIAGKADKRVRVVYEPVQGYGRACLTGTMEAVKLSADILVFMDGDYSDSPSEMHSLTDPIAQGTFDFVIGSRTLGTAQKGALLPQARFGNFLAGFLIKLFYGFRYTDLGPFRAISPKALESLQMKDKTFGWTVEMQVKAVKAKLRICEVPVSYKKRIGKSKITGTLKGTVLASILIIGTIFRYLFWKGIT